MKILKKLLIVCCFSFLFLICNVNAATYDYPSYNVNALSGYLTKYPDKTAQDFFDLIMTRVPDDTQDFYLDNYMILLQNYSDAYSVTILIATTSDYFSLLTPGTEFRNHNGSSFRYNTLNIFFDSDYNIRSNTSYFDFSSYYTTSYGLYVNMPIYSNNDYIKYDYPGSSTGSISFDGGTAYQYGSDIPLKAFQGTRYNFDVTDYYSSPENPNKCFSYDIGGQIGIVRNAKTISFRVHDTSNALDYPIEGYFRLVSPQFNDVMIPISDYLDVTIDSGPLNEGDYNFNYNIYWVNESGETINDLVNPRYAIYFDYNLIAQDDIDTYLDVIITLKIKNTIPAGNVTFFNNPVDIYANIYNCNFDLISYGYVDNNNNYSSSDSNLLNYLQDNNLGDISPLLNTDLLGPGPVDSILLLPLNIMQSLLSVVNSNTCQPIVLPLPHLNSNITLPCINTIYNQIDGLSTFLNWVSAIISAFILYEYFIGLYKWVDNLLTFRENNHFGGF